MLGADPVVDAVDPSLQIGEDQVDDRQEFLRDLWVSAFGDGVVVESALAKAGIPLQSSVTISDPGATAFSTNPQSDLALRSGTTARRTRPA